MGMIYDTISVNDRDAHRSEDEQVIYHMPGFGSPYQTACGFVDVHTQEHDPREHPMNCSACMEMWKEAKTRKFVRGYFARKEKAIAQADDPRGLTAGMGERG